MKENGGTITYNKNNHGVELSEANKGLTDTGKQILEKLNNISNYFGDNYSAVTDTTLQATRKTVTAQVSLNVTSNLYSVTSTEYPINHINDSEQEYGLNFLSIYLSYYLLQYQLEN